MDNFLNNFLNLKIETPAGYKKFSGIRRLQKPCFEIITEKGSLICSADHILLCDDRPIFAEDLKPGVFIQHRNNILCVQKTNFIGEQIVYDITDVDDGHLYYTNDIISHNCSFSGSSWTLLNGPTLASLVKQTPLREDKYGTKIYKEPVEGHFYTIGIDTAKYGEGDYLSMQVTAVTTRPFEQVATFRKKDITYLNLVEPMFELGTYYNNAMLFVENNSGDGQSAADLLMNNYDYENIYAEKKEVLGFRTTTKTRKIGLQNLKQSTEDSMLIINDEETISELQRFALKNGKYQAVDGYSDDAVMALVASLYFMQIKSFMDQEDLHKFFISKEMKEDDDTFVFGFMSNSDGSMMGF